jgi:uncharacterized protein
LKLRSQALASAIIARFIKPDGLVATSTADANLILPTIDLDDHATPSGTSAAYALLAQLGKTDERFAEAAVKVLARMADRMAAAPANWASFTAYAALFGQSVQVKPEAALDSAAHVKAAAQGASHADHDDIIVTLSIDPSYHVNANPASADYLMPTVVTVPGAPDAKIAYPEGQIFKPKFLSEGISVYDGSVDIRVEMPKGRLAPRRVRRCALKCKHAPRKSVCHLQLSLHP